MYDLELDKKFEEIKLKMWVLEELQIMPPEYHNMIVQNFLKCIKEM